MVGTLRNNKGCSAAVVMYLYWLIQEVCFYVLVHAEDDSHVIIDCDSRSKEDIFQHVKKVLGKSE